MPVEFRSSTGIMSVCQVMVCTDWVAQTSPAFGEVIMGLNTTFITGPEGVGAAETREESASAERARADWSLANMVGLR